MDMDKQTRGMLQSFPNYLRFIWDHHNFSMKASLGDIELDIARYLQDGPRYRGIIAFREVGKTHLTCIYVTWRLWRDPSTTVVISSASQRLCQDIMSLLRSLVETTPWLRHLRPRRSQNERTGTVAFDVRGHRGKDASITGVSITSQLPGRHCDLVVADDIETLETSITRSQRVALQQRATEFYNVAYKDTGHVIFLGTPHHYESVYHHLSNTGIYKFRTWPIEYPRISDPNTLNLSPMLQERLDSGEAKPGDPTCPYRYDVDKISDIRRSQGARYESQYQCRLGVSMADDFPLRLQDFVVHSMNRTKGPASIIWGQSTNTGSTRIEDIPSVGMGTDGWYGPVMVDTEWSDYTVTKMFVDPSGGKRDHTAWSVISELHGNLFVHDVASFEGAPTTENLAMIIAAAKNYRVNDIYIEQQFGGEILAQVLRPLIQKDFVDANRPHGIKAWGASISEVYQRGQKEIRIINVLSVLLGQHRLIIDPRVARNQRLAVQISQIQRKPRSLDYDDEIDSLAGCCSQFETSLSQDHAVQAIKLRERRLIESMELEYKELGLGPARHMSWIHI